MKEKIFDAQFYKKLENIVLNANIIMNAGASGGRKSKAKGSSVEFSDYREYALGDDFRRIDWNAYGRFNKLFVKLFMEEREALINIFIDSSKSMDFGENKKSIIALKIAAVVSYLGLNNLDRVCINDIKGSSIKQSSALSGKSMFQSCVNYLENIEFLGSTNINSALKKKNLTRNGISIIISDFFSEDGIEEAVKYLLYKKQQVILIHILSDEELNPELEGKLRLLDSETGLSKDIAVTPAVLKQYHNTLKHFISGLKEFSKKMGASYIQVSSSDLIEKIVFEDFASEGILK